MLYPEFRYRRPPPSYNASMQDYQHQVMVAHMQGETDANGNCDNYSLPSSPPPTYRSHASTIRPGIHITFPPQSGDYPSSRPPTYRSNAGTMGRPPLPPEMGTSSSDTSGSVEFINETGTVNNGTVNNAGTPNLSNGATPTLSVPQDTNNASNSAVSNSETEVEENTSASNSSTINRGFKLVEKLENILDESLKSSNDPESQNNAGDQEHVSPVSHMTSM